MMKPQAIVSTRFEQKTMNPPTRWLPASAALLALASSLAPSCAELEAAPVPTIPRTATVIPTDPRRVGALERWTRPYNVVWDSPSKDSLDSMPLSGRRGAGANVWVQDGSIWLYLAHNGAYDEQGRLLKLGCVRITPVDCRLGDAGFRQELDLATAAIVNQQDDFKVSLWFTGDTLVFESTSAKPRTLMAYEKAFLPGALHNEQVHDLDAA